MTRGMFVHSKYPSERSTGRAQPAEELTESYVRWRSSRLGRITDEIARVLKPKGRLVVGELGRWSLWAAERRMRGWMGHAVWRAVKFRTAADLRRLADAAGLRVVEIHGAVHYLPCAVAAQLVAPIDLWLGRETTFEAAFLAMSAAKQPDGSNRGSR